MFERVIRAECRPNFLGNNLKSKGCTWVQGGRGETEPDSRTIYQNKMPNDTENGKNRRRKQMKRAKSEKYCAVEFVSVSVGRGRERQEVAGGGGSKGSEVSRE